MLRCLGIAAASSLLLACSTPRVVDAAFYGDLASLKKEIARAQRTGSLERDQVEDLAQAVARREVRSARGADAVARIRDTRSCARSVLPELEERSSAMDDAGAEATLVLAELGRRDWADLRERYATASSGAWRAVGARAALGRRRGALRRQLFEDPDERVRRQALRASLSSNDPADLEPLLEAARLDPDPLARSLAVRAVGRLGGQRAVLALKDLFVRADEEGRLTVVEAWAAPAALAAGGVGQLVRVAETETGLPQVAAADRLVTNGGRGSTIGHAVLVRAVTEGSDPERTLAIRRVPFTPDSKAALRKAAAGENVGVAIAALTRLLDSSEDRVRARRRLREFARGRDAASRDARAVLAAAGDSSVGSYFDQELTTRYSARRRMAAHGLVRLGRYATAASALADDDPSVRVAVACQILTESSRSQ